MYSGCAKARTVSKSIRDTVLKVSREVSKVCFIVVSSFWTQLESEGDSYKLYAAAAESTATMINAMELKARYSCTL